MSPARWRLRSATLLLAGALALHQLRYTLSPTGESHALTSRHGYLLVVVPLAGMLLALVLASVLVRMARGPALEPGDAERATDGPGTLACLAYPGRASRRRVWAAASLALIALFVTQESFEALLSSGPGGLLSLLGAGSAEPSLLAGGGWLVLPLAAAIGGCMTLGLGAVNGELSAVVDRPRLWWRVPHPNMQRWTVNGAELEPLGVLARHLAGRGPPLPSTL
jgi:hypothetical protein